MGQPHKETIVVTISSEQRAILARLLDNYACGERKLRHFGNKEIELGWVILPDYETEGLEVVREISPDYSVLVVGVRTAQTEKRVTDKVTLTTGEITGWEIIVNDPQIMADQLVAMLRVGEFLAQRDRRFEFNSAFLTRMHALGRVPERPEWFFEGTAGDSARIRAKRELGKNSHLSLERILEQIVRGLSDLRSFNRAGRGTYKTLDELPKLDELTPLQLAEDIRKERVLDFPTLVVAEKPSAPSENDREARKARAREKSQKAFVKGPSDKIPYKKGASWDGSRKKSRG